MEFERAVNGIVRYINSTFIPTMNEWQKLATRVALARILRSSREIKEALKNNYFIKTFGFMSDTGEIDVEGICEDLKRTFDNNPVVELTIPMYGPIRFRVEDVDVIKKYIMEG